MTTHILILLTIMLAAGALGGAINHGLNQKAGESDHSLLQYVLFGLGAAMLVPLFLNMISSDLLGSCREAPEDYLVILGFCLVASMSSKAFIQTISEQVLKRVEQKVEKVERIASEVRDDVEPLIERNEETATIDALPLAQRVDGLSDGPSDAPPIAAPERQILAALSDSKFTYRSIPGIAADTRLDRSVVQETLSRLEADGLARSRDRGKGVKFYITTPGIQKLQGT